ncbi:TonB-dependent receptor domain-containing protein [Desulfopila inferna]|uniref:TonB-dependent receptor domain-containing protein n=1 Tax=Desulfopila inferna TaxID=468528 RepID=UPI001962BDE3|nr:TonB-dependent receptor [Desulfopila inferna]MBM9604650.1 TonB-dependent receptor [Desulfopila inferna]
MNSTAIFSFINGLVFIFCLQLSPGYAEAAEECRQPIATIVSIQGGAQIKRDGQPEWHAADMDAQFCPGDMLRIGADGRAAVVMANESVLRINRNSTIIFYNPEPGSFSILELLRGALHIFSHRPHSLKIITPYVNGVVEGTEFLVLADPDSSSITVFSGVVTAINQEGQLQLTSGQSAIARKGKEPTSRAVVRPFDAVEWTLYYPAVIEPSAESTQRKTVYQASASLSIGQVEDARKILDTILQEDPGNSEALALLSIIETVRNNREAALGLAYRAIEIAPHSAAAGLALSYAHQASFNIPAALQVLEQVVRYNPENGLVKARLAELLLSVGQFQKGRETAAEAASLTPSSGLAQTVLGFAHLSRTEIKEARAAFSKAIEINPALPLARLGLGLADIRSGELEEGRAEIEIAAALDPGNSLIRSYLGKAYFEEKRNSNSQRQLQIARELDPADPTPWLYDAIRKQTVNRPAEALYDIQQSIARNDNRAVYRSRLLLDDDLASRSAGLGRIFTDLGFPQLARIEGWKSVHSDPSNYSAHRFLADTYSTLPRHEIARVSELLQAQLLQPINITPVQPQLAESELFVVEDTGPSMASANEFNPLFLRDRVALRTSGVIGSNDIFGDEIVVSGIEGRFSYSLGQFHYQTDGVRKNNDQEHDIYNAFFQGKISPKTSLMSEIRYKELDYGDLAFKFDPTDFSSTHRQSDTTKSVRLGIRHDLQPYSTLLGTAIASSDDNNFSTGSEGYFSSLDITNEADNKMAEIQHIYQGSGWDLKSGAGYLAADEEETIHITFPFEGIFAEELTTEHVNAYSYARIDLPRNIQATVGLSGDVLESPVKDRSEINPKFGLTWQPVKSTLVRAAAFRNVTRRMIYAQTIEPTFVAGFNQLFDDTEASTAQTYGAGIDHTFAPGWYGGLQFFHRDLEVPYLDTTILPPEQKEDDWQEDIGSAYLYWVPADMVSLGLEYFYEDYSHDNDEGVKGIRDLRTHRLTPKIRFFHPSGITAGLQASYIDQEGQFGTRDTGFAADDDQFWVIDLSLGYRLPRRHGMFTVEIKNLFDEQFKFVNTDPANPEFLAELQVIAGLTFAF